LSLTTVSGNTRKDFVLYFIDYYFSGELLGKVPFEKLSRIINMPIFVDLERGDGSIKSR